MASQYSILRNYGEYVSPYNMDLIAKGMEYMQGKVDTNRQMINDYVDQIVNSDIIKPQDRRYLQDRLTGIINDVNDDFRRSNLASDGVARSIQSRLGEAMDTRVMNAIAGTREFRKLQETIEDIKLNKPDQYSSINEAMAYMPFNQWYNDGQVGSRLAPLHYTPYYDYNKEANDLMKQAVSLRKARKTQSFQTDSEGNRTGEIVVSTIDRFTPEEAREVAMSSLSQSAMAQINLEGQYMALTNPGLFNQDSTASFIKRYTDSYAEAESALEGELRNADGNESKKAELNARLTALRAQRDAFVDEANSFIGQSYDSARAGAFVVRNEFLRGISSRWSYDNSYTMTDVDEFYFKKQAENRAMAEFEYKRWKDQQDLDIKREELRIKAMGRTGSSDNDGSNTSGDLGYPPVGTQVTVTNEDQKDVKPINEFYNSYAKNETDKSIASSQFMGSLTDVDRNAIMNAVKVARDNSEGGDPYAGCSTDADYILRYFDLNGGIGAGMITDENTQFYLNKLLAARRKERYYDNIEIVAKGRADIPMEGFRDEVLRTASLDNGGGIDVLVTDDRGRPMTMNARDVLRHEGNLRVGEAEYSPDDLLELSAITYMLSDTANKNLLVGGISDTGKAKLLLDRANDITGADMTMKELAYLMNDRSDREEMTLNHRERRSNAGYASLADMIAYGYNKNTRPIGRSWTNYPVNDIVDDASDEYKRTFEEFRDQFSEKTFAIANDANRSPLERQIYSKMETLFSNRGGATKDLVSLSVVRKDNGSYIRGTYKGTEGSNKVPVVDIQASDQDISATGYTTYAEGQDIRSELFQVPHAVNVSFASPNNRAYGKLIQKEIGLPYATVDNAKNSVDLTGFTNQYDNRVYLSDNRTYYESVNGNGKKIELEAIRDAIIENVDQYKITATGYSYGPDDVGVRVNIFYVGDDEAKGTPLYTLDYENIPYADGIAKKMDICPQSFIMDAINREMRKEYDSYLINGNKQRTVEFQNLIAPKKIQDAVNLKISDALGLNNQNR